MCRIWIVRKGPISLIYQLHRGKTCLDCIETPTVSWVELALIGVNESIAMHLSACRVEARGGPRSLPNSVRSSSQSRTVLLSWCPRCACVKGPSIFRSNQMSDPCGLERYKWGRSQLLTSECEESTKPCDKGWNPRPHKFLSTKKLRIWVKFFKCSCRKLEL